MKKCLISLALCAILALALCVPAAAFSDVVSENWYAPAVEFCETEGLMNGFPDGTFRPEEPVTRAQLVTTLWRLAGEPESEPAGGFYDVDDDVWFAPAVRWAAASGVTDGTGNGNFSPALQVSREMLATFFHRFAGLPAAEGEDFADQVEIAAWAVEAARWANGADVMVGVGGGRFDPKTEATRAALAQTLMNYAAYASAQETKPTPEELALPENCAPTGIARAEDGAFYITDGWNKAIWRLADGAWERAAGAETAPDLSGAPMGGYLDGAAEQALLRSPWGIAPFLGGWAISDPENNAVRILRDGGVATANGPDYAYPTGLAADGEGGLYIANTHAGGILHVTPEGEVTRAAEGLDNPMGLCFHDGALYIAETGARRIMVLRDGTLTLIAGSGEEGEADGPAEEASFFAPMGVAVGDDGSVYIADTVGSALRCVRDGVVTTLLAPGETLSPEVLPAQPLGLLWDGGQIYVCDRFAKRIVILPTEAE